MYKSLLLRRRSLKVLFHTFKSLQMFCTDSPLSNLSKAFSRCSIDLYLRLHFSLIHNTRRNSSIVQTMLKTMKNWSTVTNTGETIFTDYDHHTTAPARLTFLITGLTILKRYEEMCLNEQTLVG